MPFADVERPTLEPEERFKPTSTSLEIAIGVTLDEYIEYGTGLIQAGKAMPWLIGDLINYGEGRQWSQECYQVLENSGYSHETVRGYAWVCNKVAYYVRSPLLSWSHHKEIANIDDVRIQAEWVTRAIDNEWSIRELREAIRGNTSAPQYQAVVIHREDDSRLLIQFDSNEIRDELLHSMGQKGRIKLTLVEVL